LGLERTIHQAQGRRLAAIVLASDGRSTEPTSLKDALEWARGKQIPIYPVRIGSSVPTRDVEIGSVRAEEAVYLHDPAVLEAKISASGIRAPTPVRVRLMDEVRHEVIETKEVMLQSPGGEAVVASRAEGSEGDPRWTDPWTAEVEFRVKPTRVGRWRFRLEVSPLAGEEVLDNNLEQIEINVLDSRLRVLYVDGYPRYEYRYLKNALLREPTVELSVLLLEADELFVQEGSDPIRRFPETPEELGRYDVVLFGDVDPRGGWLTQAQLKEAGLA
jgi:hypothetical protein